MHGIGVHDPRHGLLVGAHVGSHHVHLRPDERNHFLREPAREPFDFVARHFGGIAGDAALGAAVGQTGERAFPAHPHRQRGDLAKGHVGMIPQSAFGGTEREMMLHPVAGEDLDGAVVQVDGQRDDQGAFGIFEPLAMALGNLQMVGHEVKLPAGHLRKSDARRFP